MRTKRYAGPRSRSVCNWLAIAIAALSCACTQSVARVDDAAVEAEPRPLDSPSPDTPCSFGWAQVRGAQIGRAQARTKGVESDLPITVVESSGLEVGRAFEVRRAEAPDTIVLLLEITNPDLPLSVVIARPALGITSSGESYNFATGWEDPALGLSGSACALTSSPDAFPDACLDTGETGYLILEGGPRDLSEVMLRLVARTPDGIRRPTACLTPWNYHFEAGKLTLDFVALGEGPVPQGFYSLRARYLVLDDKGDPVLWGYTMPLGRSVEHGESVAVEAAVSFDGASHRVLTTFEYF